MRSLILRGSALTGGAQLLKVTIQLASVLTLSRLLTPDDFGVVAAIAPVITLVALVQDFGLHQAIVQRATLDDGDLTDVFWLSVLLGLGGASVVALFGPAMAAFYGDGRLASVSSVLGLTVFLGSVAVVPLGLLCRRMHFASVAAAEVAAALVGLLAAAGLALLGFGYWSLALSVVASSLLLLTVSWLSAGFMPGMPRGRLPDRGVLSFGANLTGFSLVTFVAQQTDKVLIGRILGLESLGLYDRAYKLLMFPLQNIVAPAGRIMVPALSRLQTEPARMRDAYLRALGMMSLVAVPGMAAAVAAADEVVLIAFGPAWNAVSPIFFWLGVAALAQISTSSIGWLFVALGRTRQMFHYSLCATAITVTSIVTGFWLGGLVGLAIGYAVSDNLLRPPYLWWMVSRHTPVRAADMAQVQVPLLAAAACTILMVDEVLRPMAGIGPLALLFSAAALSYAAALALYLASPLGRRIVGELLRIVRDSIRRAAPSAARFAPDA